jgi:hypothetical protein
VSHRVIASYCDALKDGIVQSTVHAEGLLENWIAMADRAWRLENGEPIAADVDTMEEQLAMLSAILPGYFKHWWQKDSMVEWVGTEIDFKVELRGCKAPVVGTIDGLFRKGKQLWLLETKNKARWDGENLVDWLPLDYQVGEYLAASTMHCNERPAGVRYSILRRPGERRGKTETLSDFAARIQVCTKKEPEHFYERMDMRVTGEDLDKACARVVCLVNRFVAWWDLQTAKDQDLGYNSGSCEGKYGTCPFLGYCAAGRMDGLRCQV